MASSPHLRRSTFSLLQPQSWWDHLFIGALLRAERLLEIRLFKLLATGSAFLFRLLVWGVSPSQEIDFAQRPKWRRILAVAAGAAAAALIFSFVFNLLFAYAAGTLSGTDAKRIYFLGDKHNIGIYTVIAPIYVACAAAIIYVYLGTSLFPHRLDREFTPGEFARFSLQLLVFAMLLLGSDALVQYRYYQEIVENHASLPHIKEGKLERCADLTYWFVERSGTDRRSLNIAGMFYFIGNFVRLGIVAAAVFCFVGASMSMIRLGMRIAPSSGASFDIQPLREKLYAFSIIELWTKGLYFILSLHSKVWGNSCLSGHLNIRVAGALVFVIGWVALTLPRNFVEYRLWRLLHNKAATSPHEGMPDLRNQETRWIYTAASSLFFIAAATLLIVSHDGPIGPRTILEILSVIGLGWLLPMLGIHL